jgi:hypothetical protein
VEIQTDVPLQRELRISDRAIDELELGRGDDALAIKGHLILADAQAQIPPMLQIDVEVEERARLRDTVPCVDVARRQGDLELVLECRAHDVPARAQPCAPHLKALGGLRPTGVLHGGQKLHAHAERELIFAVGGRDHDAAPRLERHAGQRGLRPVDGRRLCTRARCADRLRLNERRSRQREERGEHDAARVSPPRSVGSLLHAWRDSVRGSVLSSTRIMRRARRHGSALPR